jgi:UDP-glucose 4-epimerase
MNVLFTGGTGYVGSHTVVAFADSVSALIDTSPNPNNIVLFDNLCNSETPTVDRIKKIIGSKQVGTLTFVKGDIRDTALLTQVLNGHKIDAVIHFAGLKAVGESVAHPVEYYANNVQGTISLLQAMQACNVKNIVFSSSATVYGEPQQLPLTETHPTSATNPYGRSKLHIEEMLHDLCLSDPNWSVVCLRYFNPVGAHESGLIDERPSGTPNNLMPYITQVAAGKRSHLNVFGKDYSTADGTGVRDYIHVVDLAQGHIAALAYVTENIGWQAINLGTVKGYSVLELVKAFETVNNVTVPLQFVDRRSGDIATCYANTQKALNTLNWSATQSLTDICQSAWQFEQKYS